MNKIFAGILGLMLVVGVTSSAAYAVFTDKATVAGVTFATGDANLKISEGAGWQLDINPTNKFLFTKLFPGYGVNGYDSKYGERFIPFYLKNDSTSPIGLTVKAQMTSVSDATGKSGSWNLLKDAVSVYVQYYNSSTSTWVTAIGWHTLADWYTTGFTFSGGAIGQTEQRDYRFWVKVDPTATDTISGKEINNIVFTFTGEQAL